MATVTGLTAERMLEIEASSVVDGEVISGVLFLEKHDGSQINAGSVAGPQGPQGDPGDGVPDGGTTGQVLRKASNADQDTEWGTSTFPSPTISLPASPTNGQQALFTDSLNNPTWQWLCQFDSGILDSNKWRILGGIPITAHAISDATTSGHITIAQITAPRVGLYKVIAHLFAGNGAVDPDPRILWNGSSVIDPTYAANQYNRTFQINYIANLTATNLSHILAAQVAANGTDPTYAIASLQLMPIRIS